jgi:hypothetical protein
MVRKLHTLLLFSLAFIQTGFAQTCFQQLGSASNIYSVLVNRTNQLAVNNDLNTLVFIHRNDHTLFSGHSGQLRYDISTNGGTTWTSNLGVLNPNADATLSGARYPQVIIHNPVGNTVPNNAYLVYKAPAVNTGLWGNSVNGVRKLDGTGGTENYTSTVAQQLIPANICKGAPGIYWTIDATYNGASYTGFRIWKGTWTGTDVSWAVNYTYTNTGLVNNAGAINLADWSIAFDPTGTIGWAALISHATNGPTYNQYHPVLYKTTNGGASWSGPISVTYDSLKVVREGLPINTIPANFFEVDIAVDINGNPHLLTQINNGPGTTYSVFPAGQKLYDITHDGTQWQANFIADLTAHRGSFSINNITHDNRPQISMTEDGTKIFYTWVDSDPPVVANANNAPNLFARGHDVVTGNWTCSKKMSTVCSSNFNNKMHTHTVSPTVLISNSNYIVPFVTAQLNAVSSSDLDPSTFHFSKEMFFTNADFNQSATLTLSGPANICGGATLTITAPSATAYSWNNGFSSPSISVNYADTFYVTLGTGICKLISKPIVTTVAPSPPIPTITVNGPVSFCAGDSVLLTASPASSYLWTNGATTSSIYGTSAGAYSVVVENSFGCTASSAPVNLAIYSLPAPPVVTLSGPSSFCNGDSVMLSSSYATNNNWSTGANAQQITVYQAGNYSVTHTDANGCKSTSGPNAISIYPNPATPVISSSGPFAFCDGDSILISSTLADGYSWSNGATSQSVWINSAGSYMVTVNNNNGCKSSSIPAIVDLNPLPTPPVISINGTPDFCFGGSAILASDYTFGNTWSNNQFGQSITVYLEGFYQVTHQDLNGCKSESLPFKITVYPNPATPITNYFNGTLISTVLGGQYNYQWYLDNVAITGANADKHTPLVNGLYSVSVTDTNGCSAYSLNTLVMDMSIDKPSQDFGVKIFPNPFNNAFNLTIDKAPTFIKIYNSIGTLIYESRNVSQNTNFNINLENYAAGIYVVQLQVGDKLTSHKVSKK